MTPLRAAYALVHESKLGLPALAKLLGKSSTTLNHELAPPPASRAKLGFEAVIRLTEATNDDRALLAWAEARGYRCVRTAHSGVETHDLLQAAARFVGEAGEALAMVREIGSQRLTEREIAHFEREVADIAPAALDLAERMRTLAVRQSRARATPAGKRVSLPTIRAAVAAASV